jgi:ATP-dependent Clp protease ATP-binding subunit ClpB
MSMAISPDALQLIAEAGFDPVYGARPLKRAIQQRLENPLSKMILQGKFGPKDVISVGANGSELVFAKAEQRNAA